MTGDTIRSWRLSLARDNHTNKNHSECPTCQVRHMATCNTCHRPRCGITTCKASKTPCPTCQEINTLAPDTPRTDTPSANLHVQGLHFVERITGMGSNPRKAETEDEDTDPQTDPNIRFQVVVRGWSNKNQKTRAETLLALPIGKMVKSLQHHQDILLIPRDWWPALQDTLGPEEPGWWYTVSSEMWYQGCSSCRNRWGKDHQDAERCPKCPAKTSKRKYAGSKKAQGKSQKKHPEPTTGPRGPDRPTTTQSSQMIPKWKRTRKKTRKRTRAKCKKVTYVQQLTQDGLGGEVVKPSFSTPGNCGRPFCCCVIYCHSKVFMVQATRLYSLICNLVDTCGLFRCT